MIHRELCIRHLRLDAVVYSRIEESPGSHLHKSCPLIHSSKTSQIHNPKQTHTKTAVHPFGSSPKAPTLIMPTFQPRYRTHICYIFHITVYVLAFLCFVAHEQSTTTCSAAASADNAPSMSTPRATPSCCFGVDSFEESLFVSMIRAVMEWFTSRRQPLPSHDHVNEADSSDSTHLESSTQGSSKCIIDIFCKSTRPGKAHSSVNAAGQAQDHVMSPTAASTIVSRDWSGIGSDCVPLSDE